MTPDIDTILEQVIALMVGTFDFPEEEARHRVNLWRTAQHRLEGEALGALTPHLPADEALQQVLRHVLEGERLRSDLESGSQRLGINSSLNADD